MGKLFCKPVDEEPEEDNSYRKPSMLKNPD